MKENPEHLNTQAIKLASKGNYNDAIACFRRALSLESSNYLLWYNLGVTYRDAGKFKEAKKALLHAYKIKRDDIEVLETLSLVCYHLKDFDGAFLYNAQALDFQPENSRIWNNMGVLFFAQNDYKSATEAFETAVSLSPHFYDALFNLRDTYNETGNIKGAQECQRCMNEIEDIKRGPQYV